MEIRLTNNDADLIKCAELMSKSEPWITLQMNYDACLLALEGDFKEVYTATENESFIGFAILQMKGVLRGYIQTLCIIPEYRNKGFGTLILNYCEERIFKVSPNVFICYSSFNPAAGKLYTKLGYEAIGELKNMMVTGHSEILLRKTKGSFADFNSGKIL